MGLVWHMVGQQSDLFYCITGQHVSYVFCECCTPPALSGPVGCIANVVCERCMFQIFEGLPVACKSLLSTP